MRRSAVSRMPALRKHLAALCSCWCWQGRDVPSLDSEPSAPARMQARRTATPRSLHRGAECSNLDGAPCASLPQLWREHRGLSRSNGSAEDLPRRRPRRNRSRYHEKPPKSER